MLDISLAINIGTRIGGFSPATLFAASEPGGWYDPSDLTTLFQDSTGLSPVTTPGQSVGLWLDKSKGLVLGAELQPNGNFANAFTSWTPGSAWSVVSGRAYLNYTGTGSILAGSFTPVVGSTYLLTFDYEHGSGANIARIGGTEYNIPAATGTYTVRLRAATTATLQFTTNSGTAQYYVDNISVRELPGNHLSQSSSGQRAIYGVEPVGGRRNLLTYTEQFDNAAWMKTRSSVSVNTTAAPDGTTTADTLIEDTTASNSHILNRILGNPLAAATYTYSIYAKPAGRRYFQIILIVDPASTNVRYTVMFDLQTGAVTTTSTANSPTATANAIQAAGDGWYRCVISIGNPSGLRVDVTHALSDTPTSPASANAAMYTGDGTSGIYIWGAQLEAGSFATSYIPTVASTVTRNADVATMTGTNFSSWYNQSEGTFVANASTAATSAGNPSVYAASDNSANERYQLFGSGSNWRVVCFDGGVAQADLTVAGFAQNVIFADAFAYKENDFAMSLNGSAVVTDAAGTLPTVDRFILGNGSSGSGNALNGHIRTIAYFNTRQPNAKLQTLTAPALVPSLSLDFINNVYNVGF